MKKFSKVGCPASMPLTDLADNRWQKANLEEAKLLTEIMILFNNGYWSEYYFNAESNSIPNSNIILERSDEFNDSWTNGIADWDGTIVRKPYTLDYLKQQKSVLAKYKETYGSRIGQDNIKLVDEAINKIAA